jgi:hypothetical protein
MPDPTPSSSSTPADRHSNREVASRLLRIADLLEAQEAEGFRVRAYRAAAREVGALGEQVEQIFEHGDRAALERIPSVGRSIAALIEELVETGRIGLLDRLEGHVAPEDLFCRLPGIGETLASRIHDELGVESLEDLEAAAHDGRLATVTGFGTRRVLGVQNVLDSMLRRRARGNGASPPARPDAVQPPVATVLAIDADYRSRAKAGKLQMIAPRRFNPSGEAWLPIMHLTRGKWHFTALYSNTALAHRLGRTHDWVVIYYEDHGDEGQCTVVTEYQGRLEGWRVVRGRERECLDFYARTHGWQWAAPATSDGP